MTADQLGPLQLQKPPRWVFPVYQHELITSDRNTDLWRCVCRCVGIPTTPYVGRSTGGGFDEGEYPCVVFTSPPRVRICGYTRVSGCSGVRWREALRRGAACQKIPWLHLSALSWQIVCRWRRHT